MHFSSVLLARIDICGEESFKRPLDVVCEKLIYCRNGKKTRNTHIVPGHVQFPGIFYRFKKKKKKSSLPVEFMAEIARLLETLMCLIFSCFEREKVEQESHPRKMQWNCFLFCGDCKFCYGKCNKEAA